MDTIWALKGPMSLKAGTDSIHGDRPSKSDTYLQIMKPTHPKHDILNIT